MSFTFAMSLVALFIEIAIQVCVIKNYGYSALVFPCVIFMNIYFIKIIYHILILN
ncbi:MAG: hypothetical protein RR123_01225 [Clostridia bacterium]